MYVRDWMKRQITTIYPQTSFMEIWRLIFRKHIHSLPVVSKNGKILGLIAEEDLLTKLYPDYSDIMPDLLATEDEDTEINEKIVKLKRMTAEKLMSRRIIFTRPDSHLMRALSRMIVRKVRQLPVLDDEDKLVGMISKSDIFDAVFKINVKRIFKKPTLKHK